MPWRGRFAAGLPCAMIGGILIAGVAASGNHLGKSANARTGPGADWMGGTKTSPASSDGISLPQGPVKNENRIHSIVLRQQVNASLKSDMISGDVLQREDFLATLRPSVPPSNALRHTLPLTTPDLQTPAVVSLPAHKLRSIFRRGKAARDLARTKRAKRETRTAEHDCLAKAIYFEARSESEAGQLAVANVVMNRVKSRSYPSTICGVVRQNKSKTKLNGCQFSFMCDGRSDRPRPGKEWNTAKRLAQKVMRNSAQTRVVNASVLHYHADYVQPAWSRFMRRLTKIGRHIFYTGS